MKRIAPAATRGHWIFLPIVLAVACMDGPPIVRRDPPPPPEVQRIPNMPGPEDLVVDESLGRPRLLVSSVDRTDKNVDGAIFAVDALDSDSPRARPMTIEWMGKKRRFRPHGITLLPDRNSPLLFVINHGWEHGEPEAIDVFSVGESAIRFRYRITGGGLVRPNDLDVRLLGNGVYELFVTNPAKGVSPMLWEGLVGPDSSFVARFRSDRTWSSRIHGFRYPNGVVAGPGGRLYVASSIDRCVFSCAPRTTGRDRTSIEVDDVVDNLTLERKGTLLVTGSGSLWRYLAHARSAMKKDADPPLSPTSVWRINPGPPLVTSLLFEDSGAEISAGSSAVCVGGDLYIGQVFADYVLKVADACGDSER
jgi:arylesterase / paraoxonase